MVGEGSKVNLGYVLTMGKTCLHGDGKESNKERKVMAQQRGGNCEDHVLGQ